MHFLKSLLPACACVLSANAAGHAQTLPKDPPGSRLPAPSAAPGDSTFTSFEQVYRTIRPCRIFDTRATGPIGVNKTRLIVVKGTAGFELQGGNEGGCNIPPSATAVSLQTTVLSSSAAGRLALYPDGGDGKYTYALSYPRGGNVSSTAIVELSSDGHIDALSRGSEIQLIGDATGYFAPQISAVVFSGGSIRSRTNRILGVTKTGTGAYTVTIDRNVDSCTAVVSSWSYVYAATGYTSGNVVYVNTSYQGNLSDVYFSLVVEC